MAIEMFLRVDGVAAGSRNFQHKGWAEVSSWQWGIERQARTANDGPNNATNSNEISVIKPIGMDSTALMRLFAEGALINEVDLSIVPVSGKRGAQQKYLDIKLQDVIIKSISTGGSEEENFLKETITLSFDKVDYTYHQYADPGSDGKTGALQSYAFKWDLQKGNSV